MFKKLLICVVVPSVLVCSHAFVAVVILEKDRICNYFSSTATPEQKGAVARFFKKDGQVHAGVPIPVSMLTGDKAKDQAFARSFLSSDRRWVYIMTHEQDGHKVFCFRALADDEDLKV